MSPAGAAQAGLAAGRTGARRVSVVIAAYSADRWTQLRDAVASVARPDRPALETIVVIDHNPDLLDRARRELTGAVVIPNTGARGASGARNTGVARSRGEVVAFLDDDAVRDPGLAGGPDRALRRPGGGGRRRPGGPAVGHRAAALVPRRIRLGRGRVLLRHAGGDRPGAQRVEQQHGVRRAAFDAAGGFREDFGKVGAVSRPEDTELCLRVTSGSWLYEPASAVGHWVPAQRATLRYFLRRCFDEGQGKAGLAVLDGAANSTSAERSYTARVLPGAVVRGLAEAATGDRSGALRSAAIIGGFCLAAAGFAVGCAAAAASRRARPPADQRGWRCPMSFHPGRRSAKSS